MDEVKSVLLKIEMVVDELNYTQKKLEQKNEEAMKLKVLLCYVELFNKYMNMYLNLLTKLSDANSDEEVKDCINEVVYNIENKE